MGILKKRSAAACVLIAVIIIFTVIGMNRSVARVAANTEAMFYDGVPLTDEGYTEKSIESQLENRISAALGLITLTSDDEGLSDETDSLRSARFELVDAETIPEKYAANEKLEEAYAALAAALPEDTASSDAAESYLSTLSGAEIMIGNSSYNDEAEKANDGLISGVLYPLRIFVFTDFAEYFA